MPLTNLCSRLVVTSTRWNPLLPSSGLSPCRPPRPTSRIPSGLRPSFHAPSSTATPNSRCRHLRPWVATHSVLRHQLRPASPPRKVARCPERNPCRRCRPNTGSVSQLAGTPCRFLAPRSASRARCQEARAAAACRPPRRDTPCRLEAPSAARSREPPLRLRVGISRGPPPVP